RVFQGSKPRLRLSAGQRSRRSCADCNRVSGEKKSVASVTYKQMDCGQNRLQLFGAHVGCGCRERTRLRGNASSPQSYDTRNTRFYPPLLIHVLPKGFHRISLLRTSGQVFLRGKPCTSARTARRTKTASPD